MLVFVATPALHAANYAGCGLGVFCPSAPSAGRPFGVHPAPDASAELQATLKELYGFNRSYPEQFVSWVWRALQGDLGTSIASNRPVYSEVMKAVGNTLRLAMLATLIGFCSVACLALWPGTFKILGSINWPH